MRWIGGRESENIEDRRGGGVPLGIAGGGIGTVVIVLVGLFFGIDPGILLDALGGGQQPVVQSAPHRSSPDEDRLRQFVAVVLADTEDTWREIFRQMNRNYEEPKLVLFSGGVQSACGFAQTASGPFYCPGDHKAYLDLAFFHELRDRFHAPGEFAQAYVLAHEIGHHVQTLLGISQKVAAQRSRGGEAEAHALSVRLELQADCFAGVWAFHADRARHIIEAGDIESALGAAAAVGDDRLQMRARGYVVPESFTHGSSAQRVHWFKRGIAGGSLRQCDTFAAAQL